MGNEPRDKPSKPDSKLLSAKAYAERAADLARRIRATAEPSLYLDELVMNPLSIMDEVSTSPMSAAMLCQKAVHLLEGNYHRRLHEYLAVTYQIALRFVGDDRAIAWLAEELEDGRSVSGRGVKPERLNENILHYVFIFIFFQTGVSSRNRETQYAIALKPYFDEAKSFEHVLKSLVEYGHDRLYRAALIQKKLIKEVEAKEARDEDVVAQHFDTILEKLGPSIEESIKNDDAHDYLIVSRELPDPDTDSDEVEAEYRQLESDSLEEDNDESDAQELDSPNIPERSYHLYDQVMLEVQNYDINHNLASILYEVGQLGALMSMEDIPEVRKNQMCRFAVQIIMRLKILHDNVASSDE